MEYLLGTEKKQDLNLEPPEYKARVLPSRT